MTAILLSVLSALESVVELIRESGTEPVIRVMAESDDAGLVDAVVDQIASTIKQVA